MEMLLVFKHSLGIIKHGDAAMAHAVLVTMDGFKFGFVKMV
jgi:hypothetical protein